MKKLILSSLFMATAGVATAHTMEHATPTFNPESAEHIRIEMNLLGKESDMPAGYIIAANTPYGVAFYPHLTHLNDAQGLHGFHVHQNPNCGATEKGLGTKAGGHWDPKQNNQHSTPWDNAGHLGDLPALYVNAQGEANSPVLAVKIKNINELKQHALMIHLGGDNYKDAPKKLGGGGARMVCGVIK